MTVRPDNRLADAPMVSVGCRECGARVEVRKSSWEQTSVQWNADATAACVQRKSAQALAGHGSGVFLVCSALRDSIDEAVRRGQVRVLDEGH
ncbi:ferredoxin [Mycolicibacterium sp. Dal123E01]|uniref:ferredoxin n=1 Tax=Mycolicibacterium sp. Dal123E01 TaxID=3457578 RepID=UPI00403ED0EE